MKALILLIGCVLAIDGTCQSRSRFIIGMVENISLYNPSTNALLQAKKADDIRSNSIAFDFSGCLVDKAISWHTGIGLWMQFYRFKDRIRKFDYFYFGGPGGGSVYQDSYTFDDPADLISQSYNIGWINQFRHRIALGKSGGTIGLTTRLNLYEYYRAYYTSADGDAKEDPLHTDLEEYAGAPENYFLSSANVSGTMTLALLQTAKSTLSGKVSVGSNVYSQWATFRNYWWFGVGLELALKNTDN